MSVCAGEVPFDPERMLYAIEHIFSDGFLVSTPHTHDTSQRGRGAE